MKRKTIVHAILGAACCLLQPTWSVAKDNGNPLLEPKKVFVTSESYTGDLVGEAAALLGMPFADGLEAADAICQYHAALAGLNGPYAAILSTSTIDAASRLTATVGPYRLVTGVPVAASFAGLFSTRLGNVQGPAVNLISGPNLNEFGSIIAGPGAEAWTGTTPSGQLDHAQGGGPFTGAPLPEKSFCNEWTDSTQPAVPGCLNSDPDNTLPCGLTGRVGSVTTEWIHAEYTGCHVPRRLYCAER
jgi:hypothetical protein